MSELTLIEAVKNGELQKIEALVRAGTDINQRDEQGWAALNFAAGKGDLAAVKLLVENGADIFSVGRDKRTPYMIALAAGRVSVVKYLREAQDNYPGEKPPRRERKYCKAYHLEALREFPNWGEKRINWKNRDGEDGNPEGAFTNDKIVFIHQDFSVTESVWHNENVIFDEVDSAWQEFCSGRLNFQVPDDLDLMVPNESNV
jgi:hypothetical protein